MSSPAVLDPTAPSVPTFRFIGGPAGCGKSLYAQMWAAFDSRVIRCATTGIAAINMGGSTIHSALGYYDTPNLMRNFAAGWLTARIRKYRASGVSQWCVDEASMMDGNQLSIIIRAIDEVNNDEGEDKVGLTLIGDFAQLPPVKAPYVFQVPEWDRFKANVTILHEIKRQSDPDFIAALQHLRKGDGKAALGYFGPRMVKGVDDEFDGPTIFAKNDEVDRYNGLRLSRCQGEPVSFRSERWLAPEAKEPGEWKNVPPTLDLKVGALVMVLANRGFKETPDGPTSFTYVNGDIGTLVRKVDEGVAEVKLTRTGETVMVVAVERKKQVPTGAMGVRKDAFITQASIRYMPLRLAYAATTHKSQGLSLDKVQVSLINHFFALPAMAYVALSRARTPEGLRLVSTPELFVGRVNADPRVGGFL